MLRIFNTALFLLFLIPFVSAQKNPTISGYIKDADNGETLIGATVFVKEIAKGTTSNAYGFYSISLPSGTYDLEYSYLGFDSKTETITLNGEGITKTIELLPEGVQIEEIIVTAEAKDQNVRNIEMSVNKLDMATIKSMPTLLGEVEVLRSIQLLPGVSSVGEGASGFNVRGGSIDQNLILLDEAPVYNSAHLFGFFSVFNPDAVKDVKLYKGGIPARYGGRLSSILDVRMKEGNLKKFEMNGGVGFIFSRLSLEAPIIKDKASFIIAGRRSYIDILSKPFLSDDLADTELNFYDLTLKANYKINEKNRVYLSGYFGRDNFGFGASAGFNWGNSTGTLRWNHLFSDRLFSNLTLYYSDYDYKINFGDESNNKFTWDASIDNYSIKPEFSYFINPDNVLRFGGQGIVYVFEPGNAVGVSEGETTDISLPNKYAMESAVYVENEQDLFENIKVNYGLRFSLFSYTGKGNAYEFGEAPLGEKRPAIGVQSYDQWESIKTYNNLEPRFSIKYQLNESASLKASYNRTAQYIHLVSNTTASTPIDVWTPSTNNIAPQKADQVALGFFKNFGDNTYEFSSEIYYKKMQNLVDYVDGADLLLNTFIEGHLLEGEGRAYGLELMLKKNEGRFTGWASYTLARTERKVLGINEGNWYASRYDQTHNLSLTAFYELTKRWSFSANFALISGTPTTFPTSRYEQQGYTIPNNNDETRNNVRIPTYHRMDVSATLKGKNRPDKRWKGEWVFSVYNVYNNRNPFSIYFRQESERVPKEVPVKTEAVQLSVIGNFIPSVSYNFSF